MSLVRFVSDLRNGRIRNDFCFGENVKTFDFEDLKHEEVKKEKRGEIKNEKEQDKPRHPLFFEVQIINFGIALADLLEELHSR